MKLARGFLMGILFVSLFLLLAPERAAPAQPLDRSGIIADDIFSDISHAYPKIERQNEWLYLSDILSPPEVFSPSAYSSSLSEYEARTNTRISLAPEPRLIIGGLTSYAYSDFSKKELTFDLRNYGSASLSITLPFVCESCSSSSWNWSNEGNELALVVTDSAGRNIAVGNSWKGRLSTAKTNSVIFSSGNSTVSISSDGKTVTVTAADATPIKVGFNTSDRAFAAVNMEINGKKFNSYELS